MAKEKLHLDQILRLKPTAADLFYPTVPSYEEIIEGANNKETCKRQIRNERCRETGKTNAESSAIEDL